ncbi:MAG: glycosyl hydrolase family 25 [Prevotella sp.]|nr:glycosyl hydrolase family 25 [Prevotella sp.]
MKRILLYIIIGTSALMGASHLVGTPEHVGMRLQAAPDGSEYLPNDSVDTTSAVSPAVVEELKYYFDRHDVQDEGFEMVAAIASGQRLNVSVDPTLTALSVGTWKGHQRQGTVLSLDSLQRTVVATWQADTIETGIRADSTGIYMGDFSRLKADGHGALYQPDGSYSEGHWTGDLRQGFGVQLLHPFGDEPRLQAGEWSKNRFMGERMRYTTERIYGIDIAKYQHGKGRRAVPIHWDKLRIIHIGKRGSNNVSGTADYPVSFVYIKSTEGTSIRNRFYLNDYAQARKHDIRTGAYHFWSVRTDGAEQATYFIRNTLFRDGDLPPVLDVEPTNAQIAQSGGAERLFREIRVWLKAVERHTGVKPILYVNQMFVNNHLSKQPDLKRDYRVWIARYSEYKPDVRLTYWQLCPDGRVAGIQGDVDINVFNGYKSQFEAFLQEETIKR